MHSLPSEVMANPATMSMYRMATYPAKWWPTQLRCQCTEWRLTLGGDGQPSYDVNVPNGDLPCEVMANPATMSMYRMATYPGRWWPTQLRCQCTEWWLTLGGDGQPGYDVNVPNGHLPWEVMANPAMMSMYRMVTYPGRWWPTQLRCQCTEWWLTLRGDGQPSYDVNVPNGDLPCEVMANPATMSMYRMATYPGRWWPTQLRCQCTEWRLTLGGDGQPGYDVNVPNGDLPWEVMANPATMSMYRMATYPGRWWPTQLRCQCTEWWLTLGGDG